MWIASVWQGLYFQEMSVGSVSSEKWSGPTGFLFQLGSPGHLQWHQLLTFVTLSEDSPVCQLAAFCRIFLLDDHSHSVYKLANGGQGSARTCPGSQSNEYTVWIQPRLSSPQTVRSTRLFSKVKLLAQEGDICSCTAHLLLTTQRETLLP